jgi:hypothetical protein
MSGFLRRLFQPWWFLIEPLTPTTEHDDAEERRALRRHPAYRHRVDGPADDWMAIADALDQPVSYYPPEFAETDMVLCDLALWEIELSKDEAE